MHNREKRDRNKVVINNIFTFQVVVDIKKNDEDPEPQNVNIEIIGRNGKNLCRHN